MAKILEGTNSLTFTNLTAVGADIVDAFVRKYSQIRHEGSTPGHRTIKWSNPKEKALLEALAKEVEDADPE